MFKAHPIHTDYAGPMLWAIEDAAEVLRWYRRFIVKAPTTVNGFFAFLTVPSRERRFQKRSITRRCAASSGATRAL